MLVECGPFPAAPPEPYRHALDQIRGHGLELIGQLPLPFLEELQCRQSVTGKCPGFHLGPDRLLAQLVQRQHSIRQPLDLTGISGPTTAVDQDDQCILDRRQQTGLLPIPPVIELGRVHDVEPVQKGRDLQHPGHLGAENVSRFEPVEVELHPSRAQADVVPTGFQALRAEPRPQGRERGGEGVPSLGGRHVRPQQLGQTLSALSLRFHREVDEQRQVLLGTKADRLAGGRE